MTFCVASKNSKSLPSDKLLKPHFIFNCGLYCSRIKVKSENKLSESILIYRFNSVLEVCTIQVQYVF